MSNLSHYILNEIPLKTLELLKKEFQSEKRFYWVLRNPERATAEELLILNEHTAVSIPTLLDDYKVASFSLGPRERNLYNTIQYYDQSNTEAPQNGAYPATKRIEADASV